VFFQKIQQHFAVHVLYPLLVWIVSFFIFLFCWHCISSTAFVGYADPAAYGEVASNILEGRGPVQDFVDFFFEQHHTITHVTDHWYSLFTVLLIPFIHIWGKTAIAVKFPVLLSYLFLPLSVYFLVKRLFNPDIGLLTALFTAFQPYILEYSINGWPDVPVTLMTVLVLTCYVKARDDRYWYIVLGCLLGLLCWFRASGFLIMGGLAVDFVLFRRRVLWRSLFPWLAFVIFFIIYFPIQAPPHNYMNLPFLSSHTNLSATMGYWGNPQQEHWQIFWDDPPNLGQKIKAEGLGVVFSKTTRELSAIVMRRDYFEENPPLIQLVTLPLFLFGLWSLWRKFSLPAPRLISIISLVYVLGLAMLFKMNSRYLFIVQILLVACGWCGCMDVLEKALVYLRKKEFLPAWFKSKYTCVGLAIIILIALLGVDVFSFIFLFGEADSPFPFTDDYLILGVFDMVMRNTAPSDTIMCTLPWSITFHTGRKSVMVPYGNAADILTICAKYNIDYLVDFTGRGQTYLTSYREFIPDTIFHKATLYKVDLSKSSGQGLFYHRPNWQLYEW